MWEISDWKKSVFQEGLLAWYRTKRRRFSWRGGKRNAYQVLIAEMLLRKTDAAKVTAVYDAFVVRYPTPDALALADEAELRRQLRLLGIADRARLMRRTAQLIVEEHSGRVPADRNALLQLPGVGRYIAHAVLCFAFQRDVAILDSNVIRIFERVFSVQSEKPRPRDDHALWEFASELVPTRRAVSYNRALLDFAAIVCTAAKPKCEACPLASICEYGRPDQWAAPAFDEDSV